MQKKIIYISIVAFLILCSFLAGRIGPDRRAEKMGDRITELESLLDDEAIRNREISAGLRNANFRIVELESEIEGLTESNRRLTYEIRNIGTGISTDIETVDGIIEGIRKYIPETDKMETCDIY